MEKTKPCPDCGNETNKETECYNCRNTKRAFKNELASPEYSRKIAVKHVNKNPEILKTILG